MNSTLVRLFSLPRPVKRLVLTAADLAVLPILFWVALALRYDTTSPPVLPGLPFGLWLMGLMGTSALALCGVYRSVVRAFDERFLQDLLLAVVLNAAVLFVMASAEIAPMPRSTPPTYSFLIFLWVWASRSAIRGIVHAMSRIQGPVTRVAIYGAGSAGRQLLAALRAAPEYKPVAFFDDARGLEGARVQGLRVYSGKDFVRFYRALEIDEVLVALPSSSPTKRRAVLERLEKTNVCLRILGGLAEYVSGKVSIADMREVEITDLLGRDPVPPSASLMERNIARRRVMITGAGGSIGAELCRQVLAIGPELLLVFDLSEFALYVIEQELRAVSGGAKIVPVLGSVLDHDLLTRVMRQHRIETVYHAAAYKHVPLVEWNPLQGLWNNAMGTRCAALAALDANASTFVLISTDKAVRPTNVMGASKRLAELILQALAAERRGSTRFCAVRFGNVLGSSGSVVPLFKKQIEKGGPVTVTHPEVTRYFMTIPEAAQLVIQAGAMSEGGDVFVLDMGESVKVVDLARRMIRLSGRAVTSGVSESSDGVSIVFTGLRPGEKLYEELLIGCDIQSTSHPRIMRALERSIAWDELEQVLESLTRVIQTYDVAALKAKLAEVVEGYVPDTSTDDVYESNASWTLPAFPPFERTPEVFPVRSTSIKRDEGTVVSNLDHDDSSALVQERRDVPSSASMREPEASRGVIIPDGASMLREST